MEYERALRIARKLVKMYEPACERIEIAGSVLRGQWIPMKEVKDIEIVCIPLPTHRKWKDKRGKNRDYGILKRNRMDDRLEGYKERNRLKFLKNGPRMKQVMLIKRDGEELIKVDIFLVLPPAQWGVIKLIRTGPTSFSKWLVSYRKPKGFKFMKGAIHVEQSTVKEHYTEKPIKGTDNKLWVSIKTPEEIDVFKVLDIDFLTVPERELY